MRQSLAIYVLAAALLLPSAAYSQTPANGGRAEAEYYADAYADYYRLPRELVHAVITQESDWRSSALSGKGAMGLMQLMPETAAEYAVSNPSDIAQNIRGGVAYLSDLSKEFHGDLRLVLAAYYCGPKRISTRGLKYTNADVYDYVASVRKRYMEEIERTEARAAQAAQPPQEAIDVSEGAQ
jgi:soluble lytic murein transglycosylase-like protein